MEQSVVGGVIAGMLLVLWAYLAAARGRFWRMRERDDGHLPGPADWPPVVAVVPARDEADSIARNITSLLRQDYPGALSIVLVDDQSRDGTGQIALAAATQLGAGDRLAVIDGAALPQGWTGKLWAQHQGLIKAETLSLPASYIWLTDADISHAPDTLRVLVARAEQGGYVLTSLMAELRCESRAERLLVPAFVFFFAMLYPFGWVNNPSRRTAAAAGGCMLARRDALNAIGGIAAIRGELIDDCALARRLKNVGPIWLGLTKRVRSIRPYPSFGDIGRMVSRSAYAQLDYSPLLLTGTVAGMSVVFVLPALLVLLGSGATQLLAAATWLLMAILFQPILRFYRLSPAYGLLLPMIALSYIAFTCQSAIEHARGRGGFWKGRPQANMARSQ